MNEIFQQYKGYIIVGGIVVIVLMVIVVAVMLINGQVEQPANPGNSVQTQNDLDYGFIKNSELTDQEKYLMLEAKIIIEGYGTYSASDTRGLYDVRNQSTPEFTVVIDQLIASVGQKSFSTRVNADSIKLQDSTSGKSVTLNATETNLSTNQTTQKQYQIDFVKTGDFWLVSNIASK